MSATLESVTAAAAAGGREDAGGFPRVDYQRPGQGRVSDLVLHLDAVLRDTQGQDAGRDDGRFHEVGAHRWPDVRQTARLRSAAGGRGEDGTGSA